MKIIYSANGKPEVTITQDKAIFSDEAFHDLSNQIKAKLLGAATCRLQLINDSGDVINRLYKEPIITSFKTLDELTLEAVNVVKALQAKLADLHKFNSLFTGDPTEAVASAASDIHQLAVLLPYLQTEFSNVATALLTAVRKPLKAPIQSKPIPASCFKPVKASKHQTTSDGKLKTAPNLEAQARMLKKGQDL